MPNYKSSLLLAFMDKINSIISNKAIVKKETKITRWQDFASEVCKDLRIPKEERSLVFKLCKYGKIIYADYAFLLKNKIFAKNAVRYLLAITKKQ